MRWLLKISLIAILLSGCAGWTKRDIALQGAVLAVTAVDWAQTTTITGQCSEANPIIGECGQRLDPGVYFPVIMFGEAVLMNYIPADQRGWLLGLGLGVEAKTIWHNYSDGVRF